MKYLLLAVLFVSVGVFYSQSNESQVVFTQENYLSLLYKYHPLMQKAALQIQKGDNSLMQARGAFDPQLYYDLDEKNYRNTNYFNYSQGGLKIPTWYGLVVNSEFNQVDGKYINPDLTTPNGGLLQSGLEISLLQGMFIDERRATLKQAKVFQEITENEKQIIINNLSLNATKAYWEWFIAWNKFHIYDDAVDIVQERFRGVKRSYIQGDKPAIDTLEAFIQLQNRLLNRNEAETNLQKADQKLSLYLWGEDNIPIEIGNDFRPFLVNDVEISQNLNAFVFDSLIENIVSNHPTLRMYNNKRDQLEIEQRLKREYLKPKLNLKYNLLNEPVGDEFVNDLSPENYKVGFSFKMPLLLRAERGKLKDVNIKLMENDIDMSLKQRGIENKARAFFQVQDVLTDQVELYRNNVDNYLGLLEGEKQKFENGESSLFLLNSRETKLIEAEIKWIEAVYKHEVNYFNLLYTLNNIAPGVN